MILLYNNVDDNFPTPNDANQALDREARIASLEETIRNRDQLIESMRKEVMALQV